MANSRAKPTHSTATSRPTTNGSRAGAARKKFSPLKFSTPAATKARPIKILFSAHTPAQVLNDLRERYVAWIDPEPDDDVLVELSETNAWKKFAADQTPGSWLAGMREALALTQKQLGHRLGGVSAARISDWEHDRRAISKAYAKALAKLFKIPAERFL